MPLDFKRFFYANMAANSISNPAGEFVEVNHQTCNYLGYKKEELIGMSLFNLLHPDSREKSMNEFQAMLTKGTPSNVDFSMLSKDGSVKTYLVSGNTDMTTGLTYVSFAEITDIKKGAKLLEIEGEHLVKTIQNLLKSNHRLRKQIRENLERQKALRENEERVKAHLEATNEQESEFALRLHKSKPLLGTILSSITLIAQYTLGDQQKNRERQVDIIKYCAKKLESIIYNFTSGKPEKNEPTFFDVNIFLKYEIKNGLQRCPESRQYIHTHHQGEPSLFFYRKSLGYIIHTLASNAIKYSESGSPIKILTRQKKNELQIRVIDEGIGIPKAEIGKIFDPFYRAKNAEHHEGTGMGLTYLKSHIEMRNGSIEISSILGQGTTVLVILPLENP